MPTVLRRESEPNSPMQNRPPATSSTHDSGTASTILGITTSICNVLGLARRLGRHGGPWRVGQLLAARLAERHLFSQRQLSAACAALLVGDHNRADQRHQ